MFNKKLKEIMRLTYRVKDLEERLCPCESHDWVKVGYKMLGSDPVYRYKCKKCGREERRAQ